MFSKIDSVQEPVSTRDEESKLYEVSKEIVSQTRDTEVDDERSVLLEVRMRVSGYVNESLEYQWYKEKVVSELGCMYVFLV